MQKIRNIFFALMALFGLSLIVADWQRSHAYDKFARKPTALDVG